MIFRVVRVLLKITRILREASWAAVCHTHYAAMYMYVTRGLNL